jgi:M6 family metalloprotease-like protein
MSFPFFGQTFSFKQPDGTRIALRGWGDQHRAVFETLDGFTVTKDPQTGFYNYATLTPEADELRTTGVRVGYTAPQALGLPEGIRINHFAAQSFAEAGNGILKPRWKERHDQYKSAVRALAAAAPGALPAPPARQTVGAYVGLCLLIQFPDVPAAVTQQQVDDFCNKVGYSDFGNRGSVYDYYRDNSAGKLQYTTRITAYYTAKHERSYYTNPAIPYTERARELIKEALTYHIAHGFVFSSLTVDATGAVFATNVFYAGANDNAWSEGLWPHSSRLAAPFQVASGKFAVDYQITNIGSSLELGTYCHENGHMLCDFPDLYNYSNQARGVGQYCLMCGGGNADPLNPHQICAYLKYRAGWGNPAAGISSGMQMSSEAGKNQFFVYQKTSTEYFILENRNQSGRDATLADSGLAIWHVDELGSNSEPQKAPPGHQRFECVLVQADGRDDLGTGINQGDGSDLFRSGLVDRFDDTTSPSSRWWDGSASGIRIHGVTTAGTTISFSD